DIAGYDGSGGHHGAAANRDPGQENGAVVQDRSVLDRHGFDDDVEALTHVRGTQAMLGRENLYERTDANLASYINGAIDAKRHERGHFCTRPDREVRGLVVHRAVERKATINLNAFTEFAAREPVELRSKLVAKVVRYESHEKVDNGK